MIEIRIINEEHKDDINIPNEPFPLRGKMLIQYSPQHQWTHTEEYLPVENITEMKFPDENYNYDEMIEEGYIFIGAYYGNECIGLAIVTPERCNPCLYLHDLKVNSKMRKMGVGKLLIAKCIEIAKEKKYVGLYTIGQDNNVNACLFYLSAGFIIGGFDTLIYKCTKQQEKSNIIFYYHFDDDTHNTC